MLLLDMSFQIGTRVEELGLVACTLTGKHESMPPLDMVEPIIDGLEAIVWFVACFEQANVRINAIKDVPSELCQFLTTEHSDLECQTVVHRSFFNSAFIKNLEQ